MTSRALYYPKMTFRNIEWLNQACLIFDEVGRVVPPKFGSERDGRAYRPRDSQHICDLYREGAIINVRASDAAMEQISQRWINTLNSRKDNFARLKMSFNVSRRDHWPRVDTPSYDGEDRDPRLGYILVTRIAWRLREFLLRNNLAVQTKNEDWIGVHPHLEHKAILELAGAIAGARGDSLCTDHTDDFADGVVSQIWNYAGLPGGTTPESSKKGGNGCLAQVAFALVQPRDVGALSSTAILRIREKTQAVRNNFHIELNRLIESFNTSDYATIKNDIKDLIESSNAKLEEELRKQDCDAVFGIFVKSFIISTGAASLVGPVLGVAAGLIAGLVELPQALRQAELRAAERHPLAGLPSLIHSHGNHTLIHDEIGEKLKTTRIPYF